MQDSMKSCEKAKKMIAKKLGVKSNSFDKDCNVFVERGDKFLEIISFGSNAVISGNEIMIKWLKDKYLTTPAKDILDGNSLFELEEQLRKYNRNFFGQHLSFLYTNPNAQLIKPKGFNYVLYDKTTVKELLKDNRFSNALNYKNDVIAYGAFEDDKLVAIAGADNSYPDMWQIGIDVLPNFRNRGLATYLVKALADQITEEGKLPYYTTWSANIASMKVAMSAGFSPAWISYYTK